MAYNHKKGQYSRIDKTYTGSSEYLEETFGGASPGTVAMFLNQNIIVFILENDITCIFVYITYHVTILLITSLLPFLCF